MESQAQLQGTNPVLHQFCVSVLNFKVRKSLSLRYNMGDVWLKDYRITLVMLLFPTLSKISVCSWFLAALYSFFLSDPTLSRAEYLAEHG
jgi:hypothetical protein